MEHGVLFGDKCTPPKIIKTIERENKKNTIPLSGDHK